MHSLQHIAVALSHGTMSFRGGCSRDTDAQHHIALQGSDCTLLFSFSKPNKKAMHCTESNDLHWNELYHKVLNGAVLYQKVPNCTALEHKVL